MLCYFYAKKIKKHRKNVKNMGKTQGIDLDWYGNPEYCANNKISTVKPHYHDHLSKGNQLWSVDLFAVIFKRPFL